MQSQNAKGETLYIKPLLFCPSKSPPGGRLFYGSKDFYRLNYILSDLPVISPAHLGEGFGEGHTIVADGSSLPPEETSVFCI